LIFFLLAGDLAHGVVKGRFKFALLGFDKPERSALRD
jgi:hypothetical protein